jgi:DEAD/DEAH box helicase domain-containing protein
MDDEALRRLLTSDAHEQVVSVSHRAARAARWAPLPNELAPELREALAGQGVERLYSHQREAFDLLSDGAHVVVATSTASGKSLCFTLPTLDSFIKDETSRALYLYPTKALAQDQARKVIALRLRGVTPAIYDGDTPQDQRAQIRARATIVLSNPDMLHVGILPNHERWAEFIHRLRYVVLDEAHVYRGVFGSHVAQVIRRLRRICAAYGSDPQFVLASATIANPQPFAEKLVGLPFRAIVDDGAPHPERTTVFWNPPLVNPDLGERHSALAESSYVVAEAIRGGARLIAFAPTRKAAELIYAAARRRLEDREPGAADRIQPYRAGYTAQQRREIERRLFGGELDGVVTTSALELGIDVGSLDLSLVTGFPGAVTSLLQRWGRAGREGHGWAVLVAGQDALDQYFMREPERLLSRSVEEAIIDLDNPHISRAHLMSAAYERPLTPADAEYFGEPALVRADGLAQSGLLRRHDDGFVWSQPHSPAPDTSLRSASSHVFVIVEQTTGGVLGTVEEERVFRFAHPGAVYLHLGQSYLVTRLDLDGHTVLVDDFTDTYYTQAKSDKNILVAGQSLARPLTPGASLFFGTIEVTEQVIAYQKRDVTDNKVLATINLDLPEQVFTTESLWITLSAEFLEANVGEGELAGSLHATEHASIAILPLYAMCDRWDIGGLSTPWHWQTDAATIFIYDGYPGGIGLSRRAYHAFEDLVDDARLLIAECPCESGCPSCVQSPKCGNLNEPLSKQGALALLAAMRPTTTPTAKADSAKTSAAAKKNAGAKSGGATKSTAAKKRKA